ncbi:MAG: hypothetical protein GEU82_14185 [Luteitalea sp.]|nr:hypothetical protein [Luteitalea sp.]
MSDKAAATGGSDTSVTPEVGDEGGTPGDVEIDTDVIGAGSEAAETWHPAEKTTHEIVRDETGKGRRSP